MDTFRRSLATRQDDENQPLMRSMPSSSVGTLCFITMLSGLVLLWCVADQWNRSVSDALFSLGSLRTASVDPQFAKMGLMVVRTSKPFPSFNYPLALAFTQFAFMGLVFLALFWILFRDASFSWKDTNQSMMYDRRWPALVVTHIFSVFWLQALMMPTQALSIGLFAASRAMEIPATAFMRAPIVGAQLGRKTAQTVGLACAAAAILYYAYAQVSGCLCVWSGHGVTLLGPAFWIVYILLLLLPASNAVLQEGALLQSKVHPLLMLSLMNMFSCVLFLPVLLGAHILGWEDVSEAFAVIFVSQEAFMLVAWLAVQMAAISLITIGIILMTDSFWAVTLRALRVAYWWLQQVWMFYAGAALAGADVSVSMACPHSSMWSLIMLCGFALAAAAIYTDRKAEDAPMVKEKADSDLTAADTKLSIVA